MFAQLSVFLYLENGTILCLVSCRYDDKVWSLHKREIWAFEIRLWCSNYFIGCKTWQEVTGQVVLY